VESEELLKVVLLKIMSDVYEPHFTAGFMNVTTLSTLNFKKLFRLHWTYPVPTYSMDKKQKYKMSNKSNTEKSDCYLQHKISYHMLKCQLK